MDIEQSNIPLHQAEVYSLQNVTIVVQKDEKSGSICGSLEISEEAITFNRQREDESLRIIALFSKINSIGVNGLKIMVFIGVDQAQVDIQEEDEPQLLKAIKNKQNGTYFLNQNDWTLSIDLTNYGSNVVREINDLLLEYLGNGDEESNQQMQDMISADNIDENGKVKLAKMNDDNEENDSISSNEEQTIQKDKNNNQQ